VIPTSGATALARSLKTWVNLSQPAPGMLRCHCKACWRDAVCFEGFIVQQAYSISSAIVSTNTVTHASTGTGICVITALSARDKIHSCGSVSFVHAQISIFTN
jgi:hypothetical protein